MRFKMSLLVYSCLQGGVSIWQLSPAALTVKEAGPVFGRFVPGGCVCVCASLSKQRPANGHPSQSEQKNRNHINFECLCNVPDDISTLFALISSKLPSHQKSASETKQEINASRSAFLFVLTW